ncbi:P-loop containing nucleoside triphosphate hydrolase [Ostreococcus tauri]|uniref:P-loop containing nucleoside triphosphate hydrolase n=1 Tax=Ostreococcus tauri TaxID=70448 RepID=A0A096PBY1_OSTTA|nr:P-loop containing nucleoside triphosphate hydrolase [Ostreococcus tauri]CEG02179.1 P-loop containing nucleoside triphosphate hydrolase [Ostreococcus tauri]|eukprot:XP_003083108.2 P-loop containing nucleoside triphosphate hydrolase [Ostreococcus tauri]
MASIARAWTEVLMTCARGRTVGALGVALAIGLGASTAMRAPVVETDPLALWCDAAAREEVEAWTTSFGNYRTSAFVVTGVNLASREAFGEMLDFTRWMYRDVTTTTADGERVGLFELCYKYVDSEPHAPCFQITPLDCFADGVVSVPGGAEKNADFAAAYAPRPLLDSFDFARGDFNASFVEGCKQWFNLVMPPKLLFSGLSDDGGALEAVRMVFQIRDAKTLAKRGIVRTSWDEEPREIGDVLGCPARGKALDDCSCIETFNLFSVLEYGCVPEGDASQPESCCAFLSQLREHPCVQPLFASDASLFTLGNQILSSCELSRVALDSQCATLPDGETVAAAFEVKDLSSATPVRNAFTCASMLMSLRTKCPSIAEGNFTAAGECCASLEDFSKSKCHCNALGCGAPCVDLFSRGDVGQIVLFCTLSGFDTPVLEACKSNATDESSSRSKSSTSTTRKSSTPSAYSPVHVRRDISVEDAEALILDWESALLSQIEEKLSEYEHISISYMAERSMEDIVADSSRGAYVLIIVGYVVVAAYLTLYFTISPNEACGPRAALEGFFAVIAGTWASIGLSGILSHITGVSFSAATLQVLPFLSMGLGVNDFFVFASHAARTAVSEIGPDEIIKRALLDAGATITLTSAMNAAAFLASTLSPVPVIKNFGLQVAIAVACNYVAAVLIFPGILLRHLQRSSKATEAPPPPPRRQNSFSKISSAVYEPLARWIMGLGRTTSIVLRLVVLGVYATFAIFFLLGIPHVRLGLEPRSVVPQDSYMWSFIDESESRFATYPVFVVVSNVDFAEHAVAMRRLEADFINLDRVDAKTGSTNFMKFYSEYTESRVTGGTSCSANDTVWYFDATRVENPSADVCATVSRDENHTFTCMFRCLAYSPQTRPASPLNKEPLDKQCLFLRPEDTASYATCTCPHRLMYSPEAFGREFDAFLQGGTRGEISAAFTTRRKDANVTVVESARMLFYVEDVFDFETKLEYVRAARNALARSEIVAERGARAFPFEISLFQLNHQYLNMVRDTWIALFVGATAATVIMFIALDVRTTLVSACALFLIQAQLFGAMARFDVKLNGASMMNLISSTGVSVEFVVHMARAFHTSQWRESANLRSVDAFKSVGHVLVNAAFTTVLGVAPVAFARYDYFRTYFFLQWCVIVAVGVLHGVVVLPIVLSFAGAEAVR